MSSPVVETQFLVVGAGPAGVSLASFLGQNGLQGIVISSAPGTADTPRAHAHNPFLMECLRDIGLEDHAMNLGYTGDALESHRWIHSMVGVEYGKVQYWGGHPDSARDVAKASPCRYLDLGQDLLEPLLVKYATRNGFPVRFNTQLTAATRDQKTHMIICTVRDLLTNSIYEIHTKFLFGADGGRSTVVRSFNFNLHCEPSQGVAVNILFHADLSHLMQGKGAQIHWIMRPDTKSKFGITPALRMIKPWTEWMLVIFNPGRSKEDTVSGLSTKNPELKAYIRELIGDETVEVEILRIDGWVVRETVAQEYSSGSSVFILGDAAHRHPPSHGLGSNTCIQDAYNLGWKTAYVAKGLAGPGLLDTFSIERQPVGAHLVKEANVCFQSHVNVWRALGMMAPTPEEGAKQIAELDEDTPEGVARRDAVFQALEGQKGEGENMGLAMNQFYVSSAVYLDDEDAPRPVVHGDPLTTIQISTYPGSRLPHAWLDVATRRKAISTHDLAGHGSFSLFYGVGGQRWAMAAERITEETGIPIKAVGVGFGLDYHDVYRDWKIQRGVNEDGCVLVRPDRFVAWRCKNMVSGCQAKLSAVLNRVLSREGF